MILILSEKYYKTYHSLYTCWSDLFIYYACKIQVDIIVFSSHMSMQGSCVDFYEFT